MKAKELRPGQEFRTVITRRPGVTLETKSSGVYVSLDNPREEKSLHPDVVVEVERGEGA